jgi:hypothetical protein
MTRNGAGNRAATKVRRVTLHKKQKPTQAERQARKASKPETYEEFGARIWDTVLPNGVKLRDATGADVMEAGRFYTEMAKARAGKDEAPGGE